MLISLVYFIKYALFLVNMDKFAIVVLDLITYKLNFISGRIAQLKCP